MKSILICLLPLLAVTACKSEEQASIQGQDVQDGVSKKAPPGTDGGKGSGCSSTDPSHICLALKYVAYEDSTGTPTISRAKADLVLEEMNALWSQCNLSFVIEEYAQVNPAAYNLAYQTANKADLTTIRQTFQDDHTLLVVTTGTWNRAGTLGYDYANAWTTMPGSSISGAVLEKPVAANSNLIAHELGHYLSLDHVGDQYAMMNPTIYSYSENIYQSQCNEARQAAWYFWAKMLR